MSRAMRTEHSGAKDGCGFWGYRADAKVRSNHARRVNDRATATEEVENLEDWVIDP